MLVHGAVVLNCTPTNTDVAKPVILTDENETELCAPAGKCSLQFIRVLPLDAASASLYVCL